MYVCAFPWGGEGGALKWGLARKIDILSDYGECFFSTFCAVRSCFIMLAANFEIFFFFFGRLVKLAHVHCL